MLDSGLNMSQLLMKVSKQKNIILCLLKRKLYIKHGKKLFHSTNDW